jgi:hypothetical protein
MGLYDSFAPPISSTGAGEASNPASTGVVVAVIDSTQIAHVTGATVLGQPRGHDVLARLTATLGGDTLCTWRVEQSVSSTITDAVKWSAPINTPTGQSGVYTFSLQLSPGDYVRARTASTITGTLKAFLQLDPLV